MREDRQRFRRIIVFQCDDHATIGPIVVAKQLAKMLNRLHQSSVRSPHVSKGLSCAAKLLSVINRDHQMIHFRPQTLSGLRAARSQEPIHALPLDRPSEPCRPRTPLANASRTGTICRRLSHLETRIPAAASKGHSRRTPKTREIRRSLRYKPYAYQHQSARCGNSRREKNRSSDPCSRIQDRRQERSLVLDSGRFRLCCSSSVVYLS